MEPDFMEPDFMEPPDFADFMEPPDFADFMEPPDFADFADFMEPDFMEPDFFMEPDIMEPDFLDPSDFALLSERSRRFPESASIESKSKPLKPPVVRVAMAWSTLKTNARRAKIKILPITEFILCVL
jgi:hypothetical protein